MWEQLLHDDKISVSSRILGLFEIASGFFEHLFEIHFPFGEPLFVHVPESRLKGQSTGFQVYFP
jgi:hypothetical protein